MDGQPEINRITTAPYMQAQSKTKDVIKDFAQSTSLLGIQQILKKRSLAWLIAYVICVIMSIFQSWNMTKAFFEMKTNQKFTIQSKELMPFPSVTVCSNIVLPAGFDYSQVPNYNHSVKDFEDEKCTSDSHRQLWVDTVNYNILHVLRYLRSLSVENRTRLGMDMTQFIINCRFANKDCNLNDTSEILFFNNPFYGNCFTFNPAYDEKTAKYADLSDRLEIDLNLESSGFWLVRAKKSFVGVLIHEPGTAPILDLPAVHDVDPGEYFILTLELREKIFVQKMLDKPSCVRVQDGKHRNRTRYFSEKSPYLYSLEACMRSCQQNHVGKTCGVLDPTLPLQSKEYEEKHKTLMPPLVCTLKQRLTMEVCDCPLPCDITTYDITPDHNELPTAECEDVTNATEDSKAERIKVAVQFLSNIFEIVEEELQLTLSQFLGFLGGNLSLWIGLCVISLLELCELAWNLARNACKPKTPLVPVNGPTPSAMRSRFASQSNKRLT